MSRRTERLSGLFRAELADLIQSEMRDPRIVGASIISIVRVDVSPDLENATVYVSVLGDEAEQNAALQALGRAGPFLRRTLKQRISIRKVPTLHFMLDHTIEDGARMLELMRKVAAERERRPE
ncbi:MAG: 30S ribosome-binding factor RbfA [Dehalococcoidia bacterium]